MAHIGDLVPKSGIYTEPGVIVEKKEDGTAVVDTEPLEIHKYHRYSNTTGLNQEEKMQFNAILDEIYKTDNGVERLNEIQQQIDRLRLEPQNKNIVRYLRNQQSILIREVKTLPRYYTQDTDRLNV
ncbi:MAG: hypothetical protein HYW48_02760 [Deltaproteobacteria bacterium]|nr:hypothetical protein [Deltaproteobacteria bacterium]